MKLLFKVILGVAGAALVLFVALIVAVTMLLDPNDYRPYIVDAVEEASGRPFELEGDLGLELLPCCSVSLGQSRLGSPAGFPEAEFARLESAALSIRIWPLLTRREVQIGTVTLDGLELDLVRLADGSVNWEFDSGPAEVGDTVDDTAATSPIGLNVERIRLANGRVRYRDAQADQTFTVSDAELDTRLAVTGDRVSVAAPTLSFRVTGSGLPEALSVTLDADAVQADLGEPAALSVDQFAAQIRTLGTHLRVTGGGRAGEQIDLSGDFNLAETGLRDVLDALGDVPYVPADDRALARLAAQGRWQLNSDSLVLEQLSVLLDDSTLSGSAGIDSFDSLAARFDLTLDGVDLDRYLPAEGAEPAVPGNGAGEPTEVPLALLADLPVTGSLHIASLRAAGMDVSDLTWTLESRGGNVSTRLEAGALGGRLTLQGAGDVAAPAPALAGTVTAMGMRPRTALDALGAGVETASADVLQDLSGEARWRLTPRTATLEQMRWALDDTTLTGSAAVNDFDRLSTRFDLAVDRLDLDAYLPPDPTDAEAGPATGEDTELIPVELIRDLDLDGELRAGELTVSGVTLRDLQTRIRAADGILRLDPMRAGLYGGTYQGTMAIDATAAVPKLTLDQSLAAVQVNDVLQSFFGSDLLAGSLSLNLAGSGSGNTPQDLLRGLAADVSFDLRDGVYRGMNVLYQVQRARALLRNETPPPAPEHPETPIKSLEASGRMLDGVLQTNALSAETDALRLLGRGGINFVELALDYELNAEVASAAAAKLGDFANVRIPLSIEGPLTAPRVGVDLKGLLTDSVRDTIQSKARDALLKQLGEKPTAGGGGSTGSTGTRDSTDGAAADESAEVGGGAAADGAAEDTGAAAADDAKEPSAKDLLKRSLRDLLKSREAPPRQDPVSRQEDGTSGQDDGR